MKKSHSVCFVLLAVILVMGCASKPDSSYAGSENPNVPEFVLNPPTAEDAIFGTGSAKLSSTNLSIAAAEARARQSLAFTLQSHVQAMIVDYARDAGNEGNKASLELVETVGRQLTDATLTGATVVKREQTPDGAFWVLMSYKKSDAARTAAAIIDSEAARYAEFKAMEALKMMDTQLSKSTIPPVPVTQ
jgi:hypothetical protein